MSNEIVVRTSLLVKKGTSPTFQSPAQGFLADQTGKGGPSPGDITVNADGRLIYFTELTTPGMAWLQNMEDPALSDTYVTFGPYDPATRKFYPMGELLPGEGIAFRFARDMMQQYTGSGTGTVTSGAYLRFEAHGVGESGGGIARVFIGAFEK